MRQRWPAASARALGAVMGCRSPRRRAAGGRPPRCRATGPRDLRVIFFVKFFSEMPLPLSGGRVYFYKFPNRKYIFVKNENKKYKNNKSAYFARSSLDQKVQKFSKKKKGKSRNPLKKIQKKRYTNALEIQEYNSTLYIY
jgi:hypothetical protein